MGSPQIIIIAGAPGIGKSTLARSLQEHSGAPMFEFGWIPEFRQRSNGRVPYEEEEQISFENLVLVTVNYLRHGYHGLILTDLANKRIAEIEDAFRGYETIILTLITDDEAVLKERVLDPERSSGYRDWEEALAINRTIKARERYPNEIRINITGADRSTVLAEALKILEGG